jgi:hypothetical protein
MTADPWGEPEPTQPLPEVPIYGRASVPPAQGWPQPGWRQPTAEEPVVPPRRWNTTPADARELGRRAMSGRAERERVERSHVPIPKVSWYKPGVAARRRRMDGWGFTFSGLLILFCGWGVWAAGGGSGSSIPPVVNLVFVIAVGGIVFAVLRLISKLLVEGVRHRQRLNARWEHFLTGTFLAVVGVSYLLHNALLTSTVTWVREQWQQLPM